MNYWVYKNRTEKHAYVHALDYINSTGCDNTQINCQHCHPEA